MHQLKQNVFYWTNNFILSKSCILMKVRFLGTSMVTAVEIQGWPGSNVFVEQYRLEFSADCVTFQPVTHAFDTIKVFFVINVRSLLYHLKKKVTLHQPVHLTCLFCDSSVVILLLPVHRTTFYIVYSLVAIIRNTVYIIK